MRESDEDRANRKSAECVEVALAELQAAAVEVGVRIMAMLELAAQHECVVVMSAEPAAKYAGQKPGELVALPPPWHGKAEGK